MHLFSTAGEPQILENEVLNGYIVLISNKVL